MHATGSNPVELWGCRIQNQENYIEIICQKLQSSAVDAKGKWHVRSFSEV